LSDKSVGNKTCPALPPSLNFSLIWETWKECGNQLFQKISRQLFLDKDVKTFGKEEISEKIVENAKKWRKILKDGINLEKIERIW
jgi:hypothetical protein